MSAAFFHALLPPPKPTLDGRQARLLGALLLGGVILGFTLDLVTYTQRDFLDGWQLVPRLPIYVFCILCMVLNLQGFYRVSAFGALFGLTFHSVALYYSSSTLEAGLASLATVFLAGILVTPWESLGVLAVQILVWMMMGFYPSIPWLSNQSPSHSPAENALNIMGYGLFALMVQMSLIHFIRQTMMQLDLARKQADAGSEAKSRFLSHISHELRTPAAGIIGILQLVLKQDLSPQTRRELEMASVQGEFQLDIINDLLDMAKIEAGRFRIEIQSMNLGATIEDAIQPFRSQAATKGLQFILRNDNPSTVWIESDPQRLRQILVNLVGNAIKFTDQGAVQIQVSAIPSSDAKSLSIQIQVTDSGIGVPSDFFPKLFKPFEQATSNAKNHARGTGLGLAISKQLAEALGGSISVQSIPDQGSTFTLLLNCPIVEPARRTQVEAEAPLETIEHRLRILLVDDVATNRYIAKALLERMGQFVECAEDGRQACEKLADQRFDLVLMDMRMPVMNGPQAATCIRNGGLSDMPVLDSQIRIAALTANASAEDRQLCLEHGMNGFLIKPLREKDLLQELSTTIASQQARGFTLPFLEPNMESDVESISEMNWKPVDPHHPEFQESSSQTDAADARHSLAKIHAMWPDEAFKRIEALRDALELGDWESLAREAHNVKGAARYLQFSELAETAAVLEQAADTQRDYTVLASLTAELEAAIRVSLETLKVKA